MKEFLINAIAFIVIFEFWVFVVCPFISDFFRLWPPLTYKEAVFEGLKIQLVFLLAALGMSAVILSFEHTGIIP